MSQVNWQQARRHFWQRPIELDGFQGSSRSLLCWKNAKKSINALVSHIPMASISGPCQKRVPLQEIPTEISHQPVWEVPKSCCTQKCGALPGGRPVSSAALRRISEHGPKTANDASASRFSEKEKHKWPFPKPALTRDCKKSCRTWERPGNPNPRRPSKVLRSRSWTELATRNSWLTQSGWGCVSKQARSTPSNPLTNPCPYSSSTGCFETSCHVSDSPLEYLSADTQRSEEPVSSIMRKSCFGDPIDVLPMYCMSCKSCS